MENYDAQMAARVWQRVQSRQADIPAADVFSFLQEEAADLSRYLQLQNILGSAAKPLLQQLIQMTRSCIAVLQGMAVLLTDAPAEVKAYPLPKELPLSSLRYLYGSTLQRGARYGQRRADKEYGYGFAQLETEAQQRCILLLQLIGTVPLRGK